MPGDLSDCTPPPDNAPPTAVEAWMLVNEVRLGAGAGCIDMVEELNNSAQSHCDYRTRHANNPTCLTNSAHNEVPGCEGFTGRTVGEREIAAGYPRQLAYTEVALSYGDDPARSIPGWLVTPFHRIPILDPWTTDMGWGGGPDCDVINFGRGTAPVPDDLIATFPYPGQENVPPTFNGLEAPAPPMPQGGWPSSYPVSIHAKNLQVTEHTLTKDGSDTPLPHLWLDQDAPEVSRGLRSYFSTVAMLYGAPFDPNTTYRVHITGTHAGQPLDLEWTFTTGEQRYPWQ